MKYREFILVTVCCCCQTWRWGYNNTV